MKRKNPEPGPNEPILNQKKIADKLKELRIQSGYTQMEIADKLEVTVAYISSIESGRSKLNLRTLLCYSCAARFLALASNTSAEAEACQARVPEGISMLGMYGNGEFCPLPGNKTGKLHNFFHNFTFTIMAV